MHKFPLKILLSNFKNLNFHDFLYFRYIGNNLIFLLEFHFLGILFCNHFIVSDLLVLNLLRFGLASLFLRANNHLIRTFFIFFKLNFNNDII